MAIPGPSIHERIDTALRESREAGWRDGIAAAEQCLVWLQTWQPRTEQMDAKWFESQLRRRKAKLMNEAAQ